MLIPVAAAFAVHSSTQTCPFHRIWPWNWMDWKMNAFYQTLEENCVHWMVGLQWTQNLLSAHNHILKRIYLPKEAMISSRLGCNDNNPGCIISALPLWAEIMLYSRIFFQTIVRNIPMLSRGKNYQFFWTNCRKNLWAFEAVRKNFYISH